LMRWRGVAGRRVGQGHQTSLRETGHIIRAPGGSIPPRARGSARSIRAVTTSIPPSGLTCTASFREPPAGHARIARDLRLHVRRDDPQLLGRLARCAIRRATDYAPPDALDSGESDGVRERGLKLLAAQEHRGLDGIASRDGADRDPGLAEKAGASMCHPLCYGASEKMAITGALGPGEAARPHRNPRNR